MDELKPCRQRRMKKNDIFRRVRKEVRSWPDWKKRAMVENFGFVAGIGYLPIENEKEAADGTAK